MNTYSWEKQQVPETALTARVFSPTNIALAKYWGKRDSVLNLPTNGSISATIKDIGSFTTVSFDSSHLKDRLILNGKEATGGKIQKLIGVLDILRKHAGVDTKALVQSTNNFPTGAGLASSASGLSAVTLAAATALKISEDRKFLSRVARVGSGSSCRSFFGGFAEWFRGEKDDGSDSYAEQIASESHWNLRVLFLMADEKEKKHASTGGMEITRKTSPYFPAWIKSAEDSLLPIRRAIQEKDFMSLASEAEVNCFRFHTSAIAANPPILYWQGKTLDIIHKVWQLREAGLKVFFTIDAGPNVVVFSEEQDFSAVKKALSEVKNIQILESQIGPGAVILE